MNLSTHNELIRRIQEFETSMHKGGALEKEREIFEILVPLFENDGYQLEYKHGIRDGGIDFLGHNGNSTVKIGIQYKHFSRPIAMGTVRELIGTSVLNSSINRMILLTNSSYSPQIYRTIENLEPIQIELLTFADVKNWVSRIELETDIYKLDYDLIIKVLSKRLIELVLKNPSVLLQIEWRELEKTIAEMFEGIGFQVTLTPPSKDGGKDIILECSNNKTKQTYIVEIKHWRSLQRVGQTSIKDFIKVICNEKRNAGLFLSTYGFTENAFEGISEIERKQVRFGSENKILSLCKRYQRIRSGIWEDVTDLNEVFFEDTV